MGGSSKILLDLEANKSSASSIESKLLFCANDELQQPQAKKTVSPESKPTITSVPKSQVLGKLKDFLPVMSDANKKLQLAAMDNANVFDIETLEDNDSPHIEMDLMLGVADLYTSEAVAAAEAAINSNQATIPVAASGDSDEDEENDSSSSSEDDDEEEDSDSSSGDEDEQDSDGSSNHEDEEQNSSHKNDQGKDDQKRARSPLNLKRAKSASKESSEELKSEMSGKRPKIVELC